MAAFRPFGQLDYQPIQIAPPQPHYNQFSAQQTQPSISPHSTTPQPGFELQQPHPITHTPRSIEYPLQDPFQWMLNSFTTLLQAQQHELSAKLEELVTQQNVLSTKLDTIQQSTKNNEGEISSINSSLQTITKDVSQLGKDMASRDAMLAERLSTLDDAIDPECRILGITRAPSEILETSPASDAQSNDENLQQKEPPPKPETGVQFQPAVPGPVTAAVSTSALDSEDAHLGSGRQTPVLPFERSSSTLSSPEPSPQNLSHITGNTTPPRPKAISKVLQKVKQLELGVAESPRRSGRTPKKRSPGDALVTSTPTPSRKRKSTVHDDLARTPAKKLVLKKQATDNFDWSSIPFRDEPHLKDQLIQCETCDIWYHWTCVNIDPEDPMLRDEDLPWACPPCIFEAANSSKGKARSRASLKHSRCRPDCDNDHGPEKFAIESIIGRFPDHPKHTMQYLLKWEGYAAAEATWTPELEIGNAAPVLVQKFETVGHKEGHDLSNRQSLILLKEASDAGWGWNQAPPI